MEKGSKLNCKIPKHLFIATFLISGKRKKKGLGAIGLENSFDGVVFFCSQFFLYLWALWKIQAQYAPDNNC